MNKEGEPTTNADVLNRRLAEAIKETDKSLFANTNSVREFVFNTIEACLILSLLATGVELTGSIVLVFAVAVGTIATSFYVMNGGQRLVQFAVGLKSRPHLSVKHIVAMKVASLCVALLLQYLFIKATMAAISAGLN